MSHKSSSSPPYFKSTSELARGDYVVQPGENVLLSVEDVPRHGLPRIRRVEGPFAGTVFTATHRFGRRWIIVSQDDVAERMLARLMARSAVGDGFTLESTPQN